MSSSSFELIGIGNPIMDLLAHVPENFLTAHVAGEKGGMVLVDHTDIESLVAKLGTDYAVTPGGSAANAVLGATKLGLKTTFLGKIGGDVTARDYRANFTAASSDMAPPSLWPNRTALVMPKWCSRSPNTGPDSSNR
jgi:sugar/nucleoside kinase (ribokinase family)